MPARQKHVPVRLCQRDQLEWFTNDARHVSREGRRSRMLTRVLRQYKYRDGISCSPTRHSRFSFCWAKNKRIHVSIKRYHEAKRPHSFRRAIRLVLLVSPTLVQHCIDQSDFREARESPLNLLWCNVLKPSVINRTCGKSASVSFHRDCRCRSVFFPSLSLSLRKHLFHHCTRTCSLSSVSDQRVNSTFKRRNKLICFLFPASEQEERKSHDDRASAHRKKKKRHVFFDAKNTDGMCASLLEANRKSSTDDYYSNRKGWLVASEKATSLGAIGAMNM